MKKNYSSWLIMVTLTFLACSKDNVAPEGRNGDTPVLPKEKATVYFQMDAAAFKSAPQTKAVQAYDDVAKLRVLAFRQNGDDYLYIGDVDKAGITHNGTAFTGKAQLPIGTYRFIPAYGLPDKTDENVSLSPIDLSTPYSDNLMAGHLENGVLPAIFLQKENVAAKDYVLGMDSEQTPPTVSLSLTRAVARLDIQFVQGVKNNADGKYNEKKGPVFGKNTDLATLNLSLKNLNPSVQLSNGQVVTENITPVKMLYPVDLSAARTNGKGEATIYGQDKSEGIAYDYDHVSEEDFIDGSAHICGPFLFPYTDEANQGCDLTMTLVSTPDKTTGQVYTRPIHINKVPLIRNKVTLIKIFSGEEGIFYTNANFEIVVNEAWDGHTEISGSVEDFYLQGGNTNGL